MNLEKLKKDRPLFEQIKEMGYSDRQTASLLETTEDAVRAARYEMRLLPVYGIVDTCAAEFKAETPYFYSTYERTCNNWDMLDNPIEYYKNRDWTYL